jgi:hypothetical protein
VDSEKPAKIRAPKHPQRKLAFFRWQGMRLRCYDQRHKDYRFYGARGIRVCDRWQIFRNFVEDVGFPPSPEHSLDRINNDGNYEPGNVRWATREEQNANRRAAGRSLPRHFITVDGQTLSVNQWAKKLGLHQSSISHRIRKYGDVEAIRLGPAKRVRLTTPPPR